ncbi:8-oxo-dGTP diphosphatase MutT [Gammaproteobacteria bacterium]|nr:8-oxo-dGTP diphosphatase MutT [Gammaproteobacteria bacterium]
MPNTNPQLEVVAGVIFNDSGEVLINQRTQPPQFAGQWEFPGGKIEPGETPQQALCRELAEELGIKVLDSTTLISISHDYPHATVRLQVRTVHHYEGTPWGVEGQAIQWVLPDALHDVDFLEANDPVIDAVNNSGR